jgi:hypothetical protein
MLRFLVPRAIAVSATLALAPTAARAQDADRAQSSPAALAIEAGKRGVLLYERGDWLGALTQFEAAEALYHSPVFVLYTARSLRNAGHLPEAEAWFSRVSAEQLDASAPELWQRAQENARAELRELREQLKKLASAPKPDTPPVAQPPTPALKPLPRAAISVKRGLYLPGLAIASAGGAAVAAGGVVGVLALSRRSALRDELPSSCEGMKCPISQRSSIESNRKATKDLAVAADALWISGVAVAAVGVVLLLIDPRADAAAVSAEFSTGGGSLRFEF